MKRKPRFISLEGIEGVGKTTHARTICNYLEKQGIQPITLTHEPGKTELGQTIREQLLRETEPAMQAVTELLLLCASRVENIHQVIRPAMEQGHWVICDRFFDSSLAYQGGGRGLPRTLIESLIQPVCGDLWPDLTFLLYTDRRIAQERLTKRQCSDRFEDESDAFFERVQSAYHDLADQDPKRWRTIDSSKAVEDTRQEIEDILDKFLLKND